jgi:5,10-methylenetetrahydrofolate reductase
MSLKLLTEPKSLGARIEIALKRAVFDCRGCGQCLLSQCGGACPMNCPKGLRNGPCGGMLGGQCEVFPEKHCVWQRVREGQDAAVWPHSFRQPADPKLFGTSSWVNFLSGADMPTRVPVSLDNAAGRVAPSGQLWETLRSGRFVISIETRTPHLDNAKQMQRRLAEGRHFKGGFDCVCVTSHPGCVMPETFCAEMNRASGIGMGLPMIGRDRQPGDLNENFAALASQSGISTLLALTGDYMGAGPFPMDSTQILSALSKLRWQGPRPLFAASLNLQARPMEASLARVLQKSLAGAEVFFSQVLLGAGGVVESLRHLREKLNVRQPVLLGVPLVGTASGLEVLARLPGIQSNSPVFPEFRAASNLKTHAWDYAMRLARFAASQKDLGVAGIHIMPFGAPAETASAFAKELRQLVTGTKAADPASAALASTL